MQVYRNNYFFNSTIFLFLFLLTACNQNEINPQNYIAHGGGEYKNIKVSNSREAVLNSLKNGIKYIELDLLMTKDNVLVAAHDWVTFRELADISPLIDNPLTSEEVANIKFKEDLTPLIGEEIVNLLIEFPELILVTDKISDSKIIQHYFGDFHNRVIVECFTQEDYNILTDAGFKCFMSRRPTPFLKGLVKKFFSTILPFPQRYVTSIARFSKEMTKNRLARPYNYEISLYTASNREEADSIFALYPNVSFIYVDNIEAIK